jgi:glycerophosphoryl diester phosphodiesterase
VKENPWLDRRVISFAHQGGSFEAPSSTLAAVAHAIEAGAGAIELDVHATVDGHLVVCHDATVDRTTDGSGSIASMTLDEVRSLDNAHWFVPGTQVDHSQPAEAYRLRGRAPEDRTLGIATLVEVLEAFPGVVLNLDIKRTAPEVEPYEALLARVLAEHDRREDVIVASFNDLAIRAFRALSPSTPTSAATIETVGFVRALLSGEELPRLEALALQVPEEFSGVPVVDERFVVAAHEAGLAVHVWTINERAAMERLVDIGVDGVISDRPSLLGEVLGPRSWQPGEQGPRHGARG